MRVRALVALAMTFLPLLSTAVRAETHLIEVTGGVFVPAVLTVDAGDTLRVVNRDGVPHTFTADDGSYDSGRLMDGDATQLVLASTGTHDFRCTLGGQRVRVMVEASRGAVRHGG
jgi:plastocyanin